MSPMEPALDAAAVSAVAVSDDEKEVQSAVGAIACEEGPIIPDAVHSFGGKVHLVRSAAEKRHAEEMIRNATVLGIDLEWRPDRRFSNDNNRVALVQVSTFSDCFLFRTTKEDLPCYVRDMFLDRSIVKFVASFDLCDAAKLKHSFDLDVAPSEGAGFCDVASWAEELNLPKGLKRLVSTCGWHMKKIHKIGCSDWAQEELTEDQVSYAVDDAFFTLAAGKVLLEKMESRGTISDRRASFLASTRAAQGDSALPVDSVDNRVYKEDFLVLRSAVIEVLSEVAASWVDTTALQQHRTVRAALRTAKLVSLNRGFLSLNRDKFAVRVDQAVGRILVKLKNAQDDDEMPVETAEQEIACAAHVLRQLEKYQPNEWVKHYHVVNLNFRVLDGVLRRFAPNVETAWEESGLLLRLREHPFVASSDKVVSVALERLAPLLGASRANAEQILLSDAKAAEVIATFPEVRKDSSQELGLWNSLMARVQIIADAHRYVLLKGGSFEEAKTLINDHKPYRKALGGIIHQRASGHGTAEKEAAARQSLAAVMEKAFGLTPGADVAKECVAHPEQPNPPPIELPPKQQKRKVKEETAKTKPLASGDGSTSNAQKAPVQQTLKPATPDVSERPAKRAKVV